MRKYSPEIEPVVQECREIVGEIDERLSFVLRDGTDDYLVLALAGKKLGETEQEEWLRLEPHIGSMKVSARLPTQKYVEERRNELKRLIEPNFKLRGTPSRARPDRLRFSGKPDAFAKHRPFLKTLFSASFMGSQGKSGPTLGKDTEREEQKAREKFRTAPTDSEAKQELSALARLTGKGLRELAREELLRLAQHPIHQPRPTVSLGGADRHQGVPSPIRVLLRGFYEGKCQLCSFTFEKSNGEPYFEIHHLVPAVGHHLCNLLVVCPNCHAQFEHATVTDFKWVGNWLVGATINGERIAVRQPLAFVSRRRHRG